MASHGTGPTIARTELKGFSASLNQFKKYSKIATGAQIRRMLQAKAEIIKARSQELVPKDTMRLHDSCDIRTIYEGNGRVEIVIVYDTFYAVYVHEVIYAPSGAPVYHEPPTQAKYLDQAVRDTWDQLNSDEWARTFQISGFEAYDVGTSPEGRGDVVS